MVMSLRLDWASFDAAQYACRFWHYSKKMPAGKTSKIGVWENNKFIGAVIFSGGPSPNIWKTFDLNPLEGSELSRVALTSHQASVSKIISIAVKLFIKANPKIKLIISYADQKMGHHGGIYQAANWFYLGEFGPKFERTLYGKKIHERNMRQKILDGKNSRSQFKDIKVPPKHKYALAFDPQIKSKLMELKKNYPKRAQSIDIDVTADQAVEGGENPTCALQLNKSEMDKTHLKPKTTERIPTRV